MNPWGAIFDWDGVVIDSSRQHELSWEHLAREEGRKLSPDHFKRGFGMKNETIIPELLQWTRDPAEIRRLSLRKEELYRHVIRSGGIAALPGVKEFLTHLVANGIPRVIGSSTHRENIACSLELIGLADFFDAVVSSEDVSRGKPDPEVFLRAAEKLGMTPARCVVFEDTHVGIEAARAAGMKVVGISGTHPPESLMEADHVVARLDELSVAQLSAWFPVP
jgi:beta-phosphoglucomutase family hydrolase